MNSKLIYIWLIVNLVFSFSCKNEIENTVVSVSERQILVNNTPYIITGICYHPVPIGSNERSFESLEQDLKLMTEAGINTIRVYSPIDNKEVLDKINAAGIKVIVGFGYNQNGFYDIVSGSFIDYVKKFKDHNAILMWELGNEYNYHPEWFKGDIKNWYTDMNNAADLIHKVDSNHPVSSAHGDLPDSTALNIGKSIDVWGMNVYRMDRPETIFPEWEALSSKPMYLSEAGADSYMANTVGEYEAGENQKMQADANKKILEKSFDNKGICSGVTLFSFTDGWWKAGSNDKQDVGGWAPEGSGVPYDRIPNEEYWGIVDIHRVKKETFNIVKEIYLSKKQ